MTSGTASEARGMDSIHNQQDRPAPDEKPLRKRKRRMLAMAPQRAAYEAGLLDIIQRFSQAGFPVKVRMLPFKPTCGATTRKGGQCRCFSLANGRCRLHGGLSTGPKTEEGWKRTREGYAAWRAGRSSKA